MTPEVTVTYVREALMLAITTAGPLIAVALIVGLTVSLFQATTQLHEPTLSFAPKAIAVGLTLSVLAPHIVHSIVEFMKLCFERAANVLQGGG